MTELNVKVGDKVIYHTRYYDMVATVTKITPTGRIRIDKSTKQFGKDGMVLGGDSWDFSKLTIYTEESENKILAKKRKQLAISLMRDVKESDLSVEDAEAVIQILKKYKK